MVKVGKWIAKHRVLMLIIGFLLIIPSVIGMAKTRVNYDLLSYLPEHLETCLLYTSKKKEMKNLSEMLLETRGLTKRYGHHKAVDSVSTVSYTHLDVYKRQGLHLQ